jgi:hypothetical protein
MAGSSAATFWTPIFGNFSGFEEEDANRFNGDLAVLERCRRGRKVSGVA